MRFSPSALSATALLGLLLAAPAQAELSLTFGGDMNFNSSRVAPRPDGSLKGGRLYSYKSLLAGIAPLIDGDLNFANVETVVTDRKLPDTRGTFVFSTHPNAILSAIDVGFNLFTLANNHTGDHGPAGMRETIDHTRAIARERSVYFNGLGEDREDALRPTTFEVNTASGRYTVALMSVTGVSNTFTQAGPGRPGTLYLRDGNDLRDALSALRNVRADYKIFSVHGGVEGKITLDPGQRSLYRRFLDEGDADLVLGHHPHRVRPVEKVGHKVIFYSLGNYLMLGASNINGHPDDRDYGLLGKLHLEWDSARRRLVAQAVEAIPLYDMQLAPKPLPGDEAAKRIRTLNQLNKDQLGAEGVQFGYTQQGFGARCLGQNPGPRAAPICGR